MHELEIERERPSKVLIFDHQEIDPQRLWDNVSSLVPVAGLTFVSTPQELRQKVDSEEFDIVVLNSDLDELGGPLLFKELQLKEYDARVLVVTPTADPPTINNFYLWGCHSCVIKQDNWLSELGKAIAAQSRLKRMGSAALKTQAKSMAMNQVLLEKNRRLDEFSMTIAHDIRGPLGGISMNLEYVLDVYGEGMAARCQDLLKRAMDSASRLTNIVQAMYEYAKLGAQATKMAEVSLEKLVQEVASDLQFDPALDIKIGIDTLPAIWGNADLLRRVFINLINNAVKYNDKQEIVINIGLERLVPKSIGEFCEVFVADNGPGIPALDLKAIFNMFTRSSSSSKDKEGLGIGLAVVHRIVELHYGEIRVESGPGQGTKFLLTLPTERIEIGG
jgi:signal transduction histidine kinase